MRIVFLALAIVGVAFACAPKKKEDPATTILTEKSSANLQKISLAFLPDSMKLTLGNNPCQGMAGIVDCQTVFMRLYLQTAKTTLELLQGIVADIGTRIGPIADGATGTYAGADGQTGEYTKTNADTYTVLIKKNGVNAVYVSVNGATYRMKVDWALVAPDQGITGVYQFDIDYTGEEQWSVLTSGYGTSCDSSSVRQPQSFRVKMSRDGSLWRGKGMAYAPRWAVFNPDPTCATTPTDANGMALYADLVGDAAATKYSFSTLKRTRGTADIATTPISAFCTEFSSLCTGGNFSGETPASYSGFVCTVPSGARTWGSSCASQSATVAAASFGPTEDWTAPSDLAALTLTVSP